MYLRADKICALRERLAALKPSLAAAITSQEMDPEELLRMFFEDMLRVPPLLTLRDGNKDERDECVF